MHIICLDIETTGLKPDRDKIIEIGVALVNMETRQIEKTFETFVAPGVTIPHLVTNLTGITDEDLIDAPKLADKKEELINFVGNYPIMGHNIGFDLDFLEATGIPLENTRLDSMDIAHIAIPQNDSYSLEIVADKLDIKETGKHRALKDVENNIEIMFALLDIYFSQKIDAKKIIEKSESPWKEVLLGTKYQVPSTELKKEKTSSIHTTTCNLQSTSSLVELPPYKTEQLIPENPELKTIIATQNQDVQTLLEPNQYLDPELFKKLLEKPTLTADETVFALKIMQLEPPILRTNISLPQNIKNIWFDYCRTDYTEEIIKQTIEEKITILSHYTLAQLAKNDPDFLKNTHLIIDEIDEFHGNVQRPITYFEKRLRKLPEETHNSLTILFGYIGMMYDKYGDQFALELQEYHFSTPEWQKIADLIDRLTEELKEDSEEARLLKFLSKAKGDKQIRIEIYLNQSDEPNLKITPLNIGEFLAEKVWPHPSRLTLVSTAITYPGEPTPGQYLKRLLQLPENIEVETNHSTLSIQHYTLPNPKDPTFSEKADALLLKELPNLEKPLFILANSQKTALQLHGKLALQLKEQGIKILAQGASGGMGKIKKVSERDPENTVIIGTYEFWKYISPLDSPLSTLIIYRVPFPHPSTVPFVPPQDFNGFTEYALPVASLKMKKIAKTAKKIISFNQQIKI